CDGTGIGAADCPFGVAPSIERECSMSRRNRIAAVHTANFLVAGTSATMKSAITTISAFAKTSNAGDVINCDHWSKTLPARFIATSMPLLEGPCCVESVDVDELPPVTALTACCARDIFAR